MTLVPPGTGVTGIATFRADDGASTPVAHNITLSGKLTGGGALTKTGAGTLTLSATNDYTGDTTISAGTLALGASGTIASSNRISIASSATFDVSAVSAGFSVTGGHTLAGAGSVVGALKLSSGAFLAPGFAANSPGALSLGSLAVVGGSTLDLSQFGDMINASSLSYSGTGAVSVMAPSGLTSNYTLLTLSSGVPDKNWFQLSGAPANYALAVEGSNLVVAVPEPTGMATLLIGCAGLLSRRRRRKAMSNGSR
jgi:autotransporter-associated beta strand protein